MKNNERSYKKFEEEKTMEDYEINNNEAKESKKSVLGWVLGGLGVLAAAGAGAYVIHRVRKNKKAKAETEVLEGYDDDESLELEDLD